MKEDQKEFIEVSKELLDMMEIMKEKLYKSLTGCKSAAQKFRVLSVEFEKKAKVFRKVSPPIKS